MAVLALNKEERFGLGMALAMHGVLVAVLLLRPDTGNVVTPPERITVTISDEVGLRDTAPNPVQEAAANVAPTLGEPAAAEPVEQVEPEPLPPRPEPVVKPVPKPVAKPVAKPVERPQPRPSPAPKAASKPEPAKAAPQKAPAKPASKPAEKQAAQSGGSRVGADFLDGVQSGTSATKTTGTPATSIGPAVQASLSSAISRQLKPKWVAPQGPGAEDLVTILSFNLNRDGSLAGKPQVVRQLGITDVNRPQADRHAEQAVRAVELAAPFNLPEEYYDAWKRVSAFRFDKRLSQ